MDCDSEEAGAVTYSDCRLYGPSFSVVFGPRKKGKRGVRGDILSEVGWVYRYEEKRTGGGLV